MSASAKRALAFTLAVALLAVLAIVLARVERGRVSSAPHPPRAGHAPAAARLEAPAPSPGERSSPAVSGGSTAAPLVAAEDELGGLAPARDARILAMTGRVVDEDGAGIAAAEILFHPPWNVARAPELLARSGADGSFAGELRIGQGWFELLVLAEGWTRALVPVHTEVQGSLHLGVIVLAPGGDVRGVVVDESGAPVEGAWVAAYPAEAFPADEAPARDQGFSVSERVPEEFADEHGRFHLRGVGLGPRFIGAVRLDAQGWGWCEPFELFAGSMPEVRVVLPIAARLREVDGIAGVVRDPGGRPLAGIRVTAAGREDSQWVMSEADGTFSIDASWLREDGGVARVCANDPELRFGPVALDGIAPGTRGLELALEEPTWLRLALRDPAGEPIPWGHVRAARGPHGYAPVPELDLGRSGKARIPKPVQTLALEAEAPGFRKGAFGPYEPLVLEDELVLVLEPGQALRGRVSFEGRSIAGATLDLCRTEAPGKWSESLSVAPLERPFAITGRVQLETSDGTTDASGAFVLTIPDDGWYGLRVEAAGFPTLVCGPFDLSIAGHDGLEVELERAGALEGRVLVAAGTAPLGRIVGVSDGWGYARTTTVGEDGSYRFDDLAPGRYQMRSCAPPVGAREVLRGGRAAREDPIEWDCTVQAGATTRFDLDLAQEGACVLAGSFGLGGEDPRGWRAELRDPTTGATRARARIGRDGRFALAVSVSGLYRLELADEARALTQELVLAPGEQAWELRPDVGTLRIVLDRRPPENSQALLRFVQEPPGAPRLQASFWLALHHGEDFRLFAPAGPGRLELRANHDGAWRVLAELEIRSGAETAFTLPADVF